MSLSRRAFLRNLSVAGGGLTLGFPLGLRAAARIGDLEPNAFLRITTDGDISVQISKAEMGQGVITGILTLVAEGLGVSPADIRYAFAPVDSAYRDPEFHMQLTGSSTSLRVNYRMLRNTGAAARDMLLRAASERSELPVSRLACRDGVVVSDDGRVRYSFGELASRAGQLPVPDEPGWTPAPACRFIGKYDRRVDARAKSDGSARFGIDAGVPDALVAVVVRPPAAQGAITSFSAGAAATMPGVTAVLAIDSGVAVVASNYWRAYKAAEKVSIQWRDSASPLLDSAAVDAALTRPFEEDDFTTVRDDGEAPRDGGARELEAEYNVPFLAHAPMEPLNCTVVPGGRTAEVWVGTQAPDLARAAAAHGLGLEPEAVTVHNQFLGGGFGRRLFPDNVYEAAQVARAVGRPVKLLWSREDDIRHDYYRPVSKARLRARIADAGHVQSWEHRIAAPSVMQSSLGAIAPDLLPGWVPEGLLDMGGDLAGWRDSTSVEGAKQLPYGFSRVVVAYRNVETPLRVGFWRSVGHSINAFVVESFVDELAHATGTDPVAFRRRYLPPVSRQRQVLDAVVELARWGHAPAGRFQGLAVHESFETVVAEVVEISMAGGRPQLERVYCAVHCGLAVNPDIVRAQMESGIVFGLTAALKGRITFKDGAVVQGNFDDYPVLRMNEVPAIEVVIVESGDPPTGVGEPGVPPAAPALGNAIFAATGRRLRDLPFDLS